MAYFLAGVATAELFKGDELFASARTLLDSSITIGITPEEIRGGEGNALWGKYFHDSSFDMKLTDIMFDLNYVAANVGGTVIKGGDIFYNETATSNASGEITLAATAVPVIDGSPIYAYIRPASARNDKRTKVLVQDNKITGLENNTEYCIRYMYTEAGADKLVVSSQFIPDTLTAFLTATLYTGDASNPESGTKAGSVTIKIYRYQLSGAMEISMTSSGASQTSLEGSALADSLGGCDGAGRYAELVQYIFGAHWFDDAAGIMIADNYIEAEHSAYDMATPQVYAWYYDKAPKLISNAILTAQESALAQADTSKLVYSIEAGTTGLNIDSSTGAITGTAAAGTATVSVEAQMYDGTPIPGMDASATIVLS